MIHIRLAVALAAAFTLALAMLPGPASSAGEARSIYGIHDHTPTPTQYLNIVKSSGYGGWVTATVEVGHNPYDTGGVDFRHLSDQGHTVICRINNGYAYNGTIPAPQHYDDFAKRIANFVKNSKGCNIWVIGNETNLALEWPEVNGRYPFVSPQDYAACFRKAYDAIKAVRPDDKVVSQALAPWGGPYGAGTQNGKPHDANPLSWVQYMSDMLTAIKSTGGIDGIALHINSRGYKKSDIYSTEQKFVGGLNLYWSFYVYKDWINYGIPEDLYHLPLYATECNGTYYWKGGHPERPDSHYEAQWMQEIFKEINRWNQEAVTTGKPVFRCVNMYRWCAGCDGWNIDGSSNPYKNLILSDLQEAVNQKYLWPDITPVVVDDSDPGFSVLSGQWPAGTMAPGRYGASYRFNQTDDGTGRDRVQWTPDLDRTGLYEISVWYPDGANRAGNAPYRVRSLNGETTVRVNQQMNGGQWISLGTFPCEPGKTHVILADDAFPSVVVADAVQWIYRGDLPATSSISGAIRDANGAPVAGATIAVTPVGQSVFSQPNGFYQLTGLRPGVYNVIAQKSGHPTEIVQGLMLPVGSRTLDFVLSPTEVQRIGLLDQSLLGKGVRLADKVVSANFGQYLWLQEMDRSSGLLVYGNWPEALPGSVATVTGLHAISSGERLLYAAGLQVTAETDPPVPLVVGRVAGGWPGGGAPGASVTGLLITAAGRVSGFPAANTFELSTPEGAAVTVLAGKLGWLPAVDTTVSVTGIARYHSSGGQIRPAIECTGFSSVQTLAP